MKKYSFVLLTEGVFGGAERRFAQLFRYLSQNHNLDLMFIVSYSLYYKIREVFPGQNLKNLIPVGTDAKKRNGSSDEKNNTNPYSINHPGFLKQLYRFTKNYKIQKRIFYEIERIRKEKNIKCFIGIYSGILPLYFYLQKKKRDVGIIFCNMDSWFRDVLPDEKKYWYRKFSSFNYALEKSDYIDFLSPFILNGIRDRGIKVRDEAVSITPCSFTDYSKCRIGDKSVFSVAFSGRLEKDKNPVLFLESALILAKKYPDILFHIMGEGRLTSVIEDKLKEAGFPNIRFHGFHPQPTDILADTSVFVSIQTTNNYPSQSVLEAMGCGNAIIASDVGDTRMFVNEDNGVLIQLNKNELVNAIEGLYLDRDHCRKLGEYAYKYVRENHTVEKMAEYYVDLFNKAYNKVNLMK